MTAIDISLRVLDAEDAGLARVLLSARGEGAAAPVLAAGALADIRALLVRTVAVALAQVQAGAAPHPIDPAETAMPADDAAEEDDPPPAGSGRPRLLAFDF